MKYLLPGNFYFLDTPMMLSVLLVALFWGVRPALFAILLGAVALDYFSIPPVLQFSLPNWEGIVQVLPFVVAGLVIAIITGQRESARMRAFIAQNQPNNRIYNLPATTQ